MEMEEMREKNLCPQIILLLLIISCDIYLFKKSNFYKWPNTPCQKYNLRKGLIDFHSYSEYFEDLILYLLLFDIKKGFYIDVGAYHPTKVSVTKSFYLKGWRGINIEPQPGKIELFQKERPEDINLPLAVGRKVGNVTFYVNDQCSTAKKKYSKRSYEIKVKMENMSNICKTYVPEGTEIDFCKIDVEGGEKSVLLGYDFINYRPKVFCIESTIPLSRVSNYDLWEAILIKHNYTYIYSKGVNRYYVDNHIPELIERTKNIYRYSRSMYRFK